MCLHLADATKQIISGFEADVYTMKWMSSAVLCFTVGFFVEESEQPYMHKNKYLVCVSPRQSNLQFGQILYENKVIF